MTLLAAPCGHRKTIRRFITPHVSVPGLTAKLSVERLVDQNSALNCDLIIWAGQPQPAADKIETWSSWLQGDLLHHIRLIDHSRDALKHWVGKLIHTQHGMEGTVSAVMRKPDARNIKRLCVGGQRSVFHRHKHKRCI